MGCGCKKKHEAPAQQPAQIKLTESPPPRPPEPVHPVEQQEVNNIVEKLNDILSP